MNTSSISFPSILAAGIAFGLIGLGLILGKALIDFKELDRTVTVKGLSEQEHMADMVIWPIPFTEASNDLSGIYGRLESSSSKIVRFLTERGIASDEITISTPTITDKKAQQYGNTGPVDFRFVGNQIVTVYSDKVEEVRAVMNQLADLGKQGITLTGNDYQYRTEYMFNRLNEIKPEMIEEATKEARAVAEKFAEDSNSKLGKIKTANQGQFSIRPRDNNNPHIKIVRVVSTIVYYLSD